MPFCGDVPALQNETTNYKQKLSSHCRDHTIVCHHNLMITQVWSKSRITYLALLAILLLLAIFLGLLNMPYVHLNIGQLLFLLTNAELEQQV